VELGASSEQSYENPDGKRVEFRFRGLRELSVIYDELEHGAELTYSEDVGWDESTIQEWVTPRAQLAVFRPSVPSTGPDYASGEIMNKLYEKFPYLKPDADPK
jgi:hypothetical protein